MIAEVDLCNLRSRQLSSFWTDVIESPQKQVAFRVKQANSVGDPQLPNGPTMLRCAGELKLLGHLERCPADGYPKTATGQQVIKPTLATRFTVLPRSITSQPRELTAIPSIGQR